MLRHANPLLIGGLAIALGIVSSMQSQATDQPQAIDHSTCRLTRAEYDAVQMGLEQSYAFDKALKCKNVTYLGRWRNRDFTVNDRWEAEMENGSIANFTSINGYLSMKMITGK